MDGRRFDAWTKAGVRPTRRAALKALALAAFAAVAPTGAATVAAAAPPTGARLTCRGSGEVCRRDAQCCSDRCRRKRCDCRRKGAACLVDRGCCSGRCTRGTCS